MVKRLLHGGMLVPATKYISILLPEKRLCLKDNNFVRVNFFTIFFPLLRYVQIDTNGEFFLPVTVFI
jgi:hypothetical protein